MFRNLLFVAPLVILISGPSAGGSVQPPLFDGVALLRRINSAQANRQSDTFLSLEGLRDHDLIAPYRERATQRGNDEWTIDGHRLRLLLSPERTQYTATLHAEGAGCAKAWFTSESGVILAGQALGC